MATSFNPSIRPAVTSTSTGTSASTTTSRPAAEPAPEARERGPSDSFSPRGEAQAGAGTAAPGPVNQNPSLGTLKSALALAKQLGLDLAMHGGALTHPALTRDVKATRLMQFAAPYAQQLVQLKAGADPKAVAQASAAMLNALTKQGLGYVVETTSGRTGQQVFRELLSATRADDVAKTMAGLRFDSTDPAGLVAQQPLGMAADVRAAHAPSQEDAPGEGEGRGEHRARPKTMSWLGWARFRGEQGRDEEEAKWNFTDRTLVTLALGTLTVAALVGGLLSLLR